MSDAQKQPDARDPGLVKVAEELDILMQERNMKQEELSQASGLSIPTIRNILHVRGNPTKRTLRDLSEAFNLPADYFLNIRKGLADDESAAAGSTSARLLADEIIPRLDEVIVSRLEEIVVPQLNKIDGLEEQVRTLYDIIHDAGPDAEGEPEPPGGSE